MPYVMVPVPEEYVEEVMQFVLRSRARASIEAWTAESIAELYAGIDEPSRALLSYVARAAAGGTELDEAEAAQRLELTQREIFAIFRELNDGARHENRPPLLGRRTMTETLPNGRTAERRAFVMTDELAALVQEAERADLLGGPHPLGSDAG